MINLDKFQAYKNMQEQIITKKSFRGRFLYEALEDEDFADEIMRYESTITKNTSSKELDGFFSEIRNKTIQNYKYTKTAKDPNKQLNYCLRSLAYYYFLECLDEYSTISDDIIKQIKEKYPTNYLELIAQADKTYLSVDMKGKSDNQENHNIVRDDLLRKYLVLKKWQDKQHFFFEGEYWNDMEKIHLGVVNNKSLTPFELEQEILKKRLFDRLKEQKTIDLKTCSLLSELYIKDDIVRLIGGKMYGLAVLNSKNIPVPYSIVIPTFTEIKEEDLLFLRHKYDSYSVRSSADIEDGTTHSFAGMFDSYLDVKPESLLENIGKVKNSVNNERVKEYLGKIGLKEPHMAVIIQSFKEPTNAGVWIGNSENSGVLEFVEGNGEKLVSGSNTPHTEFWDEKENPKNAFEINGIKIGKKMIEYQKLTGCNSDFEWMILDDNLIMLQFRPVTKGIAKASNINKKHESIYGIPASSGIVDGEASFLEHPEEELERGKILLTKITGTSWVPNLMKANGAVTARGGFLCHTAIICRELGIPCVTGVGDEALKKLASAKRIKLNGNTGEVKCEKYPKKEVDDYER